MSTVTLTGVIPGAGGAVAVFTSSGGQAATVTATLDSAGYFSQALTATDSTGGGPSEWFWTCALTGTGFPPTSFTFFLEAANGTTQDVVAVVHPQAQVFAPQALLGTPGGVFQPAARHYAVRRGTLAIRAKDFGAKGDGVTDDTQALSDWIGAINAAGTGARGWLDWGQYIISAPLPSITANGVRIDGAGWSQTANPNAGSCITAASSGAPVPYTGGALLTVAGEGVQLEALTIDGDNMTGAVLVITGQNCMMQFCQVRGVSGTIAGTGPGTAGVLVDIQSGGTSCWIHNCRLNGVNLPCAAVQVNATDLIMTGCKPVNATWGIVLLSGASGAQIFGNHITPGSTGQNCIWINGNPSHIQISNNRFDNFPYAAVQITPPSSTPNDYTISNNDFYSIVVAQSAPGGATGFTGFALIGVDTTSSAVRNLKIQGNTAWGLAGNLPAYFLSAHTQNGSDPGSGTYSRLSTIGSFVHMNSAYAATSFWGNGTPTKALANTLTTTGATSSFSQVTDIYSYPAASGATSDAGYRQTCATVTPNATAGQYGTGQAVTPDATFSGIFPIAISYTSTVSGGDNLTLKVQFTYSDASTSTNTVTSITTSTTAYLSAQQLGNAFNSSFDGKHITAITFFLDCTNNASSASSVTCTVIGLNQN